jgi:diacylglycerol kinase (ATP)
MKKRANSFKYAFIGIYEGLKSQWNFKFHLLAACVVIALGFYFEVSKMEWCVLLLCCALVISLELINTAIELLCDFIEPNKNEKIRIIKDISAAGVLVSAIIALVVGIIILIPYIKELLNNKL